MEHLLSLLFALGDRLIGALPGWALRRFYPVPKLAQRVSILAEGVGPHLYVRSGKPLTLSGLRLVVFNPLPFRVELQRMKLRVDLESTYLLTLEKNDRTVVESRGLTQLSLDHDLTDNQALMIRQYPTGCPTLNVSGPVSVRSRVRDFTVHLQVGTHALRVAD